jgi:hypothetical protein
VIDKSARTRIYIAPKVTRLPRRYEAHDQRTVQQKLRWLGLWLLLGACFWGWVWWKLS